MRCRHFLSFVFVALSAFFSGLFITTQNSFATDYTFNIVNGTDINLCTSNNNSTTPSDKPFCDDVYSITFATNSSFDGSIRPNFLYDNSSSLDCSSHGGSRLYIPFSVSPSVTFTDISHICGVYFGSTFSLNGSTSSWVVTLSTEPPSIPSPPSGDLSITSNGTFDVSSYATATVDVPAEVIQGDYHDDLVNIQKSIIICGAVLLVLYFFYCIYRLIIKNSGVH